MSWQIAADIREMFVDIVATDGSRTVFGRNLNRKDQLTSGFAEALSLLPTDFEASGATLFLRTDYERIALREHWGSHTAFLTTEGFENLLEIGTQSRINLFGIHAEKALPLISRDAAFGVTERTRFDGTVEVGLDEKEIEFVMSKLAIAELNSVAVCFLHSKINPEHENQLARKLREKNYDVVCSHEFEGHELKRGQKACANAFTLSGKKNFLQEIQKLGFSRELIFEKSAISAGENTLNCEFLEDRIQITISRSGKAETWEAETSLLSQISIDEGGLVHVGPEKIESEPGPVILGKGIHLSVLDLLAFSIKMKIGTPPPRLKIDVNRVMKQLVPFAKQLQLDPETCAKKFLVLFYEKLSDEIISHFGTAFLQNCQMVAGGWLAKVMASPVARQIGVKSVTLPRHSGWSTEMSLLEMKNKSVPSPSYWGNIEFELGAATEGESLDF